MNIHKRKRFLLQITRESFFFFLRYKLTSKHTHLINLSHQTQTQKRKLINITFDVCSDKVN